MADIHWTELGLEKDCDVCKDKDDYDRGCEFCSDGKKLTPRGIEFLEFLVRHWDTFEEIKNMWIRESS